MFKPLLSLIVSASLVLPSVAVAKVMDPGLNSSSRPMPKASPHSKEAEKKAAAAKAKAAKAAAAAEKKAAAARAKAAARAAAAKKLAEKKAAAARAKAATAKAAAEKKAAATRAKAATAKKLAEDKKKVAAAKARAAAAAKKVAEDKKRADAAAKAKAAAAKKLAEDKKKADAAKAKAAAAAKKLADDQRKAAAAQAKRDADAKAKAAKAPKIAPNFDEFRSGIILGNLEKVKTQIQRGVNVNQTDVYGDSPLRNAIVFDKPEIMNELLKAGANPNFVDRYGDSLIHVAADKSSLSALKALKATGKVNVLTPDKWGRTILEKLESQKATDPYNYKITECIDYLKTLPEFDAIFKARKAKANTDKVRNDISNHDYWSLWSADFSGVDLNKAQFGIYSNKTALNAAIEKNESYIKKIIELLVSKGANPHIADSYGNQPLHNVAKNASEDGLKALRSLTGVNKVNFTAKNSSGKTVIDILDDLGTGSWQAGQCLSYLKTIPELDAIFKARSQKANFDKVRKGIDNDDYWSLTYADFSDVDLNKAQFGIYSDKTALNAAIEKNGSFTKNIIELLVSKGATPTTVDWNGNQPIHVAARKGSVEALKAFYGLTGFNKVNITAKNTSGQTILDIAKEELANEKMFGWFLGSKFTPVVSYIEGLAEFQVNKPNPARFFNAASSGDLDEIKAQLGKGVKIDDFNTSGYTALMKAAAAGHVNVVEYLMSQGANANLFKHNTPTGKINGADHGFQAIHAAVENGHLDVLKKLYEATRSGAKIVNISTKDASGFTVLQLAKETLKKTSNAVLIAKLNGIIAYLQSLPEFHVSAKAVFEAVEKDDFNALKTAIENGANPNEKNSSTGDTALHLALAHGNAKMIEFLIENGAFVKLKNNKGESAWDFISDNITGSTVGTAAKEAAMAALAQKYPKSPDGFGGELYRFTKQATAGDPNNSVFNAEKINDLSGTIYEIHSNTFNAVGIKPKIGLIVAGKKIKTRQERNQKPKYDFFGNQETDKDGNLEYEEGTPTTKHQILICKLPEVDESKLQ